MRSSGSRLLWAGLLSGLASAANASPAVRALPPWGPALVQADLVALPLPSAIPAPIAARVLDSCRAHVGDTEWPLAGRGQWRVVGHKDDTKWPPRFRAAATGYLLGVRPLSPGDALRVECAEASMVFDLRFDPAAPSPAVQVSQGGFEPSAQNKRALYFAWAGTLGDVTSPAAPAFRVVDLGTGDSVLEDRAKPATTRNATGDGGGRVWRCDFAALRTPGRYRVEVEGVGRSAPFEITPAPLARPLRDLRVAFTHHRCGAAIAEGPGLRPRPACHTEGGCFHEGLAETPLYQGEAIGECRPVRGGWHDASDYGRYVAPASVALFYGLLALERFPQVLAEPGPPASWAEELVWQLDWLAQMQGPGGGVYHKVTSPKYGTDRMPHLDEQRQYFAEMTTHATARTAAVMARAARVLGGSHPEAAARYRQVMERAWAFLDAHPGPVPDPGFRNRDWNGGGDYADRFGDVDERAWAAAERMMLDGEASPALEALVTRPVPRPINPFTPPLRVHDWPPTFEDAWRMALWTYAEPGHPGRDRALREGVRKAWRGRADDLTARAGEEAYGLSYQPKPGDGFGFGHMNGVRWALDLALAGALLADAPATAREGWREAAWANLGVLFGANPLGWSYFTGVGPRTVTTIEYRINLLDGSDSPLPGHPADGPASGLHSSARAAEALFVPPLPDIPPGLRYADVHDPILNEPTVLEMAETLFTFAALHARAR